MSNSTPDDPTTDDQPIPQSDQCCDKCGRPLPDNANSVEVSQFVDEFDFPAIKCPCGSLHSWVSGTFVSGWVKGEKRDPYPPHAAPWLRACDCDECTDGNRVRYACDCGAPGQLLPDVELECPRCGREWHLTDNGVLRRMDDEPDHLTEACQRATDHHSDTEDDMTNLPDLRSQLTPEQAREAPAGPETDWLVADLLGWRLTEADPRECWGPSYKMTNGDESFVIHHHADALRARQAIPGRLAFSRDPRGAHRARQWLRGQGFEVSLHDDAACATLPYIEGEQEHREWSVFGEDVGEHVLCARLLLLLAAEEQVCALEAEASP